MEEANAKFTMQKLKETKRSIGSHLPISSASSTTLPANDANLGQVNGSSTERPIKNGKMTQSPSYGSTGCQDVVKLFSGASHLSKILTCSPSQSE